MKFLALIVPALLLAGCVATMPPGTPPASKTPVYGTYFLTSINGRPISGNAHLKLNEDGSFSGAAPCNLYNGTNTATLPTFSASNVTSTRRACGNPQAEFEESSFFNALRSVSQASFPYRRLSLTGPEGVQLDFALE